MANKINYPFLQWSYFTSNGDGRKEQYVVRAETIEDLKLGKKEVFDLVDFAPTKETEKREEARTKECGCGGVKTLRTGIKNGKKWAGYFCDDRNCKFSPEWVDMTKK